VEGTGTLLSRHVGVHPSRDVVGMFAQDFYLNPRLSDVKLRLGDHVELMPAHKVILSRCRYFSTLFMSSYADGSSQVLVINPPTAGRGAASTEQDKQPPSSDSQPPSLDLKRPLTLILKQPPSLDVQPPSLDPIPHGLGADISLPNFKRALGIIYNMPVPFSSHRDVVDFLMEARFLRLLDVDEGKPCYVNTNSLIAALERPDAAFLTGLSMAEYEVLLEVYEAAHSQYLPTRRSSHGRVSRVRVDLGVEAADLNWPKVGLVPEAYLVSLRAALEREGYSALSPRWVTWVSRLLCLYGSAWTDALDLAIRWCMACPDHPGVRRVLEAIPEPGDGDLYEGCGIGRKIWEDLLLYDVSGCPPLAEYVLSQIRRSVLRRGADYSGRLDARVVSTGPALCCEYEAEAGKVCGLPTPSNGTLRCGERRCRAHLSEEDSSDVEKRGAGGYLTRCACGRGKLRTERVGVEYLCLDCALPPRERRRPPSPDEEVAETQAESPAHPRRAHMPHQSQVYPQRTRMPPGRPYGEEVEDPSVVAIDAPRYSHDRDRDEEDVPQRQQGGRRGRGDHPITRHRQVHG
jgi:hypothetical protein